MASSQSGETIGTVRSALHQAICEQSFAIASETNPEIIERATAAKDACEQLDYELASAGSAHILVNELTLRVPHAATLNVVQAGAGVCAANRTAWKLATETDVHRPVVNFSFLSCTIQQ